MIALVWLQPLEKQHPVLRMLAGNSPIGKAAARPP